MVTTGLNMERVGQQMHGWLTSVQQYTDLESYRDAYSALRGVLHNLRDRLTVEEASDFAAQLPLLLKGVFFDGWNPSKTPMRIDKLTFVSRVHAELGNDPYIDPELVVIGVMRAIRERISEGEYQDLRAVLPLEMQPLIPDG